MNYIEQIKVVDMGLINRCNLKCPVCPYVTNNIENLPKNEINIDDLIFFLEKLPKLEIAIIEGNYSEPTLYNDLPKLIHYLVNRNIKIRLSTNGSKKNDKYWEKIATAFKSNDYGKHSIIRFAIDGSTQELHSKYRVGSQLETVLHNNKIIKNIYPDIKTVLQNIIFEYNNYDKKNIKKLFNDNPFDYLSYLKCYPTNHKIFKPIKKIDMYNKLKFDENTTVICDAFARKEIYINHNSQIFLCGSLDEGQIFPNAPTIMDDVEKINNYLIKSIEDTKTSNFCKGECSEACYKLGEIFPDTLIDKNGKTTLVNYFTKELSNENNNINHTLI